MCSICRHVSCIRHSSTVTNDKKADGQDWRHRSMPGDSRPPRQSSLHCTATKRKLNVPWNGIELDHYTNLIYLGVASSTLLKAKAKANTINNLLRKLTNSTRGAHPATVRPTALALCFSTAECACSSRGRSRYTRHVDTALNETCRIFSGCLKATLIPCMYALTGIAPPHICRTQIASSMKMTRDIHSMANALPSTGFHPETAFLIQQCFC